MRIITGNLGGRQFEAPKGHRTHPMGDRIRTALFNTLGDISGLTVLDAFAGSGALALESLSRGATHATIIEQDRDAFEVILANIQILGVTDKVTTFHGNARSWSYRNNTERFDIVFCDPPYNHLQETVLEKLAKHAKVGGLLVYSLPKHGDIRLDPEMYEPVMTKNYGEVMLAFYRKIS